MKTLTCVAGILLVAYSSQAADLEAGKQIASTVCAAGHGPTGTSVSDTIPNLAGQRARYLEPQLKFFKDGTRKEPAAVSRPALITPIAARLGASATSNLHAY